MAWPCKADVNKNAQPHVECETVPRYSAIFLVNFGDFFIDFFSRIAI